MHMRDPDPLEALLGGAARLLSCRHEALARYRPSALDLLLPQVAGPAQIERGALRPWLALLTRAYRACGGDGRAPGTRRELETVLAAFAAAMAALEILDDMVDGDPPEGGRQAPNLALALIGQSTQLLCDLPIPLGHRLLALWGELWARCAAAQALDFSLASTSDLTLDQALAVARGSGLVTRWAVEAGALAAGAPAALIAPLVDFGEHLGAADKLLHDLHDLWPGAHRSRDLHRPNCSLTLVAARDLGLAGGEHPATLDNDAALRQRLLAGGALHFAWACADEHRLGAAAALEAFARAGGDPEPLLPALALSPDLQVFELQDAQM